MQVLKEMMEKSLEELLTQAESNHSNLEIVANPNCPKCHGTGKRKVGTKRHRWR